MENSGNQQQKKDWKKKGLGWIPDYPDLRDYSLDDEENIEKKLRFKIEGRIDDFEKVVEVLINLITKKHLLQEEKIKELQNQIFGNVLFAKVKVHKFLRENLEIETIKRIDYQYPCKQIKYEKIFSSQIVDLKKYLGILLMKGYLSLSKSVDVDVHVNFEQIASTVHWMRDEKYDSTTKLLVKDFQSRSKILVDGIVGIETYTTFNECFSDPKKLSQLEHPGTNINKKGLSKIKFFAVTSLISRAEFEIILDILKSKVIEQICKEFTEYIRIIPTRIMKSKLLSLKRNFLNMIF